MNTAFGWSRRRWLGVAAVAATSGTAGWAIGQHAHVGQYPATTDMVHVRMTSAPRMPRAHAAGAGIQSFADGTVSVHVDHVSASWLLLELGRRGAAPRGGALEGDDTVVVSDFSYESADPDCDVMDVEQLTRALIEGRESERHAALTRALETGTDLPPWLLRQLYESDSSDSVRLLALTTYVDLVSEDRTEVRNVLQTAVYDNSPAVQAEAQRRLSELDRFERMLAESPRRQGLL